MMFQKIDGDTQEINISENIKNWVHHIFVIFSCVINKK